MTDTPDQQQRLLLAAYDAQLREAAEMASTTSYDRAGPLWRGKFGGRGFVSYRSLDGLDGPALDELIAQTVEHYRADPGITAFEWKTRGHDAPPDLAARLIAQGFQAQEQETVMVGEAAKLAQDVSLPAGVTVGRIDTLPDASTALIRAAEATGKVFGETLSVEEFLRPLRHNPGQVEIWAAQTRQETICVGRLELIPGSDFAGLWGGGTLPQWRGQGVYRALTAARARAALARGVRSLHSDCTAFSRPILERSGLLPITTTTPYIWTR
ncbi:GNAT family N-acetyltransferase [Deinococcus sp.]|uniref:GNAT family N-acetyltransferase n=1 Tax=Deinococcus sp. TaxID=47478 RepID=UPI003C79ED67